MRKLAPQGKAPILCFVGPPGVGKTSLGQSIARAMDRKFVRVSLGGVHDEAEIRGHRRTYIGALPGNIIQAIRKAGTRNCVMMLDEIDKLGAGIQGDPGAALLEVLDPEQNNTFRDNYLAVPFDLSRVVFITTANMLDTIPGPLRDRMEIISLAGYTADEKLEIAHRYLVRRQMEANGLKPGQVEIADDALRDIIQHYTREAGVRSLERQIGQALRHAAVRIAEGQSGPIRITREDLAPILGAPQFESETAMRTSVPGVATGLAWTPVGGDILFIEATRIPGSGRLILTGQLGEVMKESAQAALSIVKNRAAALGIDAEPLREERHPRPRAGGRDPEGRAERRRRDVHGAGLADDRAHRPQRHRDDRRDQPARPGAAGRRHQGKGRRRAPRRHQARHAAGAQSPGLRRHSRDRPQGVEFVWLEKVEEAVAAALEPESLRTTLPLPSRNSPTPKRERPSRKSPIALAATTGVTELWNIWRADYRSLRLDMGRADHLGPLLGFIGDELAEVGGRARKGRTAKLGKPGLQLGIGKPCIDLAIDLVDDFRGRVLRRTKAGPVTCFEARHEITYHRNIRKDRQPRGTYHSERTQPSGLDLLDIP